MVKVCYLCKRPFEKASTRSYHLFPRDADERKKWFRCLNMEPNFNKSIVLCSDHFSPSDFFYQSGGRRKLVPNALPNVASGSRSVIAHEVPSSSSSPITSSATSTGTVFQRQQTEEEKKDTTHCASLTLPKVSPHAIEQIIRKPVSHVHLSSSSSATKSASETEQFMEKPDRDADAETGRMGPPSKKIKVADTSSVQSKQTKSSSTTSGMEKKNIFKRRKARYVGDIQSDDFSTPRKAKRHWRIAKSTVSLQKRKIKALQQRARRLKNRVNSLKSLLKHLFDRNLITENAQITLDASIPASSADIVKRLLKGPSRQKYTPELRAFALTLHFYSTKAYNYVRTKFNRSLPHPDTVSKWYRSVNAAPGFTQESLNALKMKAAETQGDHTILCNLVLDEMAIRKQIEWTGTKFVGYVDFGVDNVDNDSLPEAKEVLVFMLVALNANWKIPVGYFFLNGLSGTEKAGLIKKCLEFVADSGVTVSSLTCDGTATNLAMAVNLGVSLNIANLSTSFAHPMTDSPLFFLLDPCHMLKLIRNCLASLGELTDFEGNLIKWEFFEKLVQLQDIEGLHAANKLRKRHLQWAREKMKVKIAAQTFSNSVADALLFLSLDLQHEDFVGAGPTANFCKIFNNLFDILNTRNWVSKTKFRKPLGPHNYNEISSYLEFCKKYILGLKLNNVSVLHTNRKTGFLGFLICIESVLGMYKRYVSGNTPVLKYLLTYKLSQDHLEIFFSAVRSAGGSNNNPNCRQFEAIYKRLLLHTEIKGADSGNAVAIDNTSLLYCSSKSLTRNDNNENLEEAPEFLNLCDEIVDHDYIGAPVWHLTTYITDIVAYIAGFVVKCLKKCVSCAFCTIILEDETEASLLQRRKKFGSLTSASGFVIKVCEVAEKSLRLLKLNHNIFHVKNVKNILMMRAIYGLPLNLFNDFGDHLLHDNILNNHGIQLVKLILNQYFKIRLHHESSRLRETDNSGRVRSLLTKSILFQNQ